MSRSDLAGWLDGTGAGALLDEARAAVAQGGHDEGRILVLSAGSGAAPFTLALARALGARACTLMTPSVLGTKPFDFAVVPEHDGPERRDNVLATLGAPNAIFPDELERRAAELSALHPPRSPDAREGWAFLIGGDDQNYAISPSWVDETLAPLLEEGARRGADLYVTTSRRTSLDAESAIERVASANGAVRMLLLASRDPMNPVPGMLGLCARAFVTEDSVSMASEAVTAGREVLLLRIGRRGGLRGALQRMTERLVNAHALPPGFLWGPPRFDRLFAALEEAGYVREASTGAETGRTQPASPLNEARRAAEWILERWA